MSNIFFTSDTHLGHANIIKYCNRPFKDLETMNKAIIRNWNERVKPEDTVFHLGDFCFHNSSDKEVKGVNVTADYWLKQLNGQIIIIKGNHDGNNTVDTSIFKLELHKYGKKILLIHNPENITTKDRVEHDFIFCGHVHDKWLQMGKIINVGVDKWNFRPIKFDEIIKRTK